MKVLCFGSANLDHVYIVDHFTVPGETQGCLEYNIKCGGKGVNQAIAMAFAGNDTYFAGIIGSDGDLLKDAIVIIEVDQSGQNHILLYGGTNKEIDFEYIDEVLSHFSKGDIVVLQNEINNVPYIIERCYEKEMKRISIEIGTPVILGASDKVDALAKKILITKGEDFLKHYVKWNFKNTEKIKNL